MTVYHYICKDVTSQSTKKGNITSLFVSSKLWKVCIQVVYKNKLTKRVIKFITNKMLLI